MRVLPRAKPFAPPRDTSNVILGGSAEPARIMHDGRGCFGGRDAAVSRSRSAFIWEVGREDDIEQDKATRQKRADEMKAAD
jgi:hypothetical protein